MLGLRARSASCPQGAFILVGGRPIIVVEAKKTNRIIPGQRKKWLIEDGGSCGGGGGQGRFLEEGDLAAGMIMGEKQEPRMVGVRACLAGGKAAAAAPRWE